MTSRKLTSAVAAASLAGASVVGMAAPALAQSNTPVTRGVSDSSITAGETITVNTGSGSFLPGQNISVSIPGLGITGAVRSDGLGNASFTFKVPAGTAPGTFQVVFSGPPASGVTNPVSVPFTVVASSGSGSGSSSGSGSGTTARTSGSSLPRTGADQMVPLAITGLALVGVGAGIVVASRRRREDLPGGIA